MSEIKLIQGDCLEIMKKIPDGSIDLIVTDVPYKTTKRGGTGNSGGMCKTKEFSSGNVFKHNVIKFEDFMPEFYRTLKEEAHCYIMVNHKNLHNMLDVAKKVGFHFIKSLVWVKDNKIMGQAYMSQFEYILFFRKGKFKKINNCGTSDVLVFPNKKLKNEDGKNLHDTEKPVNLMKLLIENSTQEGDLVSDPFMGIGGSGVACVETNRNFLGIEIDEKYFQIAKERIEKVKNNRISEK